MIKFLGNYANNWVFNKYEKDFDVVMKDCLVIIDDLNSNYSISFLLKIKNRTFLNFFFNAFSCQIFSSSSVIIPEKAKIVFEKLDNKRDIILGMSYSLDFLGIEKIRSLLPDGNIRLTTSLIFFLNAGNSNFKINRGIDENFKVSFICKNP